MPVTTTTTYHVFDQKVLDRFRISKKMLPQNSVLINHTQTLFEAHKVLVSTTIAGVIILICWLLLVIVDNRKRKLLLERIRESDKKLSRVFDISHLYSWEYDMVHQRAVFDKRIQKEFSCEEIVENFPESIIRLNKISAESMETFQKMHKDLRNGAREVTDDICFLHVDGTRQWLRITYFYGKDSNEENMAAAAAIDVTEQHQILERYENALAVHTTREDDVEVNMSFDITENILIDFDYSIMPQITIQLGDSIDQVATQIAKDVDEEYREDFIALFRLEKFRTSYTGGNTKLSFDYRRRWNGKNIWMNTTVNLLEHPETNHIIAFSPPRIYIMR